MFTFSGFLFGKHQFIACGDCDFAVAKSPGGALPLPYSRVFFDQQTAIYRAVDVVRKCLQNRLGISVGLWYNGRNT
jgi:hypothetical protein